MKNILQVDYYIKKNFLSFLVIYVNNPIANYQFEVHVFINDYKDTKKTFSNLEKCLTFIFGHIEKAHKEDFWKIGIRRIISKK